MRKVLSAPCLTELGGPPAAARRALSTALIGAEGRVTGDVTSLAQVAATRKLSVSPLPGNAVLMPYAPQTTTRPSVRTSALLLPEAALSDVTPLVTEISKDLEGMAKTVEDEVVVESGLHVVGIAAGGCVQRFGIASRLAPTLVDGDKTNGMSEEEVAQAMCMATPFDSEGGSLNDEVQRSLDDMVLQNEFHFELEYALDTLANMNLSDTEGQTLPSLRTVGNRRRRWPVQFGGRIAKSTESAPRDTISIKENKEAQGNIVAISGLHGLLKKAVAPHQNI